MTDPKSQFTLLLWKDYLIRKRKLVTLGGVVWATLVMITLYVVRVNINNQDHPTCGFPARALPSAGLVPFLQSFICTINNECTPENMREELPTYENARLTQLNRQFSPLLQNHSVLETAASVPHALQLLGTLANVADEPTLLHISKNGLRVKDLFLNPRRVKRKLASSLGLSSDILDEVMNAEVSFQGILKGSIDRCSSKLLSGIIITNEEAMTSLINKVCPLSTEDLQNIFLELITEIDFSRYVKMLGNMYAKLNGDERILILGDTLTAVLRITKLDSFVPPELVTLITRGKQDEQFRYFDLSIFPKILDIFEPTFGETETFKTIRGVTDTAVTGIRWLYRLLQRNNQTNSVNEVTGLVLDHVNDETRMTDGFEKLSRDFMNTIDVISDKVSNDVSVDEIFDLISKFMSFAMKWVPSNSKHEVQLYSTLLAKLIEGAHKVVINNINMEEIVYNVSMRNPEGVKILVNLPVNIIAKAFDALTDAERTQVMTSKLNTPDQMFCDTNRIQKFFLITKSEAGTLQKKICTDAWKTFIQDLIKSFGIYEVKGQINEMASIVIQETLGRDTSDQLYTIDQDFKVLKDFTKDLINISTKSKQRLDWITVLNVMPDSDLMKVMHSKESLEKQILITVHGALAKEVVKQNTILELKISPILVDATNLVLAVNAQIEKTSKETLDKFKKAYPSILKTILATMLDEDKTYAFLSKVNEDVFCGGEDNSSEFLNFSSDVDKAKTLGTACEMTLELEKGLSPNSILGVAIKSLMSSQPKAYSEVKWTSLINGIRSLYVVLHQNFPYIFDVVSYGMSVEEKTSIQELLVKARDFWFGKRNVSKSLHLSVKIVFRLLDLIDKDIFNITNGFWLKMKYILNSANGMLVIGDEIVKLISAVSNHADDVTYSLPAFTVVALKKILPNLPQLTVDGVDVVVKDNFNTSKMIQLINAEHPWPCSEESISEVLHIDNKWSKEAITGVETILCMNKSFVQEWSEYEALQKVRMMVYLDKSNDTTYESHMFLKFSKNFDALIKDSNVLKDVLQKYMTIEDSPEAESPTFVSALNYAVSMINRSDSDVIFRKFFTKVDAVTNSIDTSNVTIDIPLQFLWENYTKCLADIAHADCRQIARTTWTYTMRFFPVIMTEAAEDLLTYLTEINEPNPSIIQIAGFTKKTGLYTLYEKFQDFVGVLLNSYWDYRFMNQIRRASKTSFWDCEAVVESLVIPPGSVITSADIFKVKPYVCPSVLYWVSLPRRENSLLDIVSKPQYSFYTLPAQNLSGNFVNAFEKAMQLKQLSIDIANRNEMNKLMPENLSINSLQNKLNSFVDSVLSMKVNSTDASYRLFSEINKNQFVASLYLTRVVAIINKLHSALENITAKQLILDSDEDEIKKLEGELMVIQKKFKRRPSEAVALHFDLITKVLDDKDEKYSLSSAFEIMCENMKNISRDLILADDKRFLSQVCAKQYKLIYDALQKEVANDFQSAKRSQLLLLNMYKNKENDISSDIFEFFGKRTVLVNSLKQSLKYSNEIGLPIYLRYLQTNVQHYDIVLSFFSGDDWWKKLRVLYNGPYATTFFNAMEDSFEIVNEVISNPDRIHLVRLLRDVNVNDTDSFCQPNVTLSDYLPDGSGLLSELKQQTCNMDQTELFKELPVMMIASQGYDNKLALPKVINYTVLNTDIEVVESRLQDVADGPKEPLTPNWITEDRVKVLRKSASEFLSKDSVTKMSFAVITNAVDAATLFLNNSRCSLCSTFTIWFKQLNLQLIKKPEYDNLLCNINHMTLSEIHRSLKNDFHWDMALQELTSTRNYTNLELNKAVNEFVQQVKIYLVEDFTSSTTKLSDCLAHNVSRNALGNATLLISVASYSLRMLRAELPHISDIDGMKEVKFLKQLASFVTQKLHIDRPLKSILNDDADLRDAASGDEFAEELGKSVVDLYELKNNPDYISQWLKLPTSKWEYVCQIKNCSKISSVIGHSINKRWVEKELPILQVQEFWRFNFVSNILRHIENMLSHVARILGVASRMNLADALQGKLAAFLDVLLQMMQKNTLAAILFSLQGFIEELHPLLQNTPLEFDLISLTKGLEIFGEYKKYVVEYVDLEVEVAQLFKNPTIIEVEFSDLGINNTNFWSLAAPRILSGTIDIKPLLTSTQPEFRIRSFVCQVESMTRVIFPSDLDVVTLDDVCGAVIEQFCDLSDEQAKGTLPVLLQNANYSFVIDKVVEMVMTKVFKASNLSQKDGDAVLAKYNDMMQLLPLVQKNVGNLTETLAQEPMFEALKGSSSLGDLLSSSKFLASAGNVMCGKPFIENDNRFYKAIAQTKDFSNDLDTKQLEALPTDFCRSLYKDIISMGGGKIVWSFIKPLLMGQILYTPPTPVVNKIIEQANATFAQMSKLANIMHNFAASFGSIELMSQHKDGVDALRSLMTSPMFRSLLGTDGDVEVSADVDIGDLLNDFGDLKGIGQLISKASNLLHCINLNRFHAAPNETKLTNEAVKLTMVDEFSAGLVFLGVHEQDGRPVDVEYKIRMDIDSVPTTSRMRNQFWTPGPEASFLEDMRYFRGFVQIQDLIDKAIIELAQNSSRKIHKREIKNEKNNQWSIYTQQTPYPCYKRDYFQSSLYESQAVVVAFFFSLIFTVCSAIRFTVSEKESGNTMLMSVMGVNLSCHTLSWFVASMLELLVTSVCMLMVLTVGGVLPRTDPVLLFALIANFAFSQLMFSYLISKLFKSASLAAVCGGLVYLVTFMPYVIILSLEALLTNSQKLITSLSMSTAFCYSILHVARYEAIGTGAQWSHIWESPDQRDSVTIGVSAVMVFVDALIYLAMGCLIERYFGLKTIQSNITTCTATSEKAGVSIVGISKIYGEGSKKAKTALDNVSIELHKGQITTLLGHNGAGKTTLIKIITGMLKPSKGHIVVRSEPLPQGSAAPSPGAPGVCPQRDVLYENLTAREHVALYARLKSPRRVEAEVDSMLSLLCLDGSMADQQVCRLSGGTRRRLCVALAFVGSPQLVLLDEPSTGVDPVARRDIWALITKLKEDRTVLMTTHHLDEAELLSDQIVIMHKGQIHTTGSPVEIKRSLGNGYRMTAMFPDRKQDLTELAYQDTEEDEMSFEEKTKVLLGVVRGVIGNAQLSDVTGLQVELILPFFDSNGLNNDFVKLCSMMEDSQASIGFITYALDCCSLEHVLTTLCEKVDGTTQSRPVSSLPLSVNYATLSSSSSTETTAHSASSSSIQLTGPLVPTEGPLKGTWREQFSALMQKRYLHYTRNRWLLFLLLILPSLFVTIAMAFSMIRPPADNEVALKLSPGLYENSTQFVVSHPSIHSPDLDTEFAESVMKLLIKQNPPADTWNSKDSPQCECTTVRQECNLTNYRSSLPHTMVLPDVDTLNNWLVTSHDAYIERRYGGFSSAMQDNGTTFVAWYNNKGHHSMVSFVNALHSALLRQTVGQDGARITAYTHPLKISQEQLSKSTLLQHVADAGISGMLLLAYCLIPAGAAVYLVTERESKQKRLQLLCGVQPVMYWAVALVWDCMIIVVNIAITVCVLSAFGFPVFVARDNLSAICLLLFLFGFACNNLTHVCEKLFSESSVATMVLFCANLFVGLSGMAVLLILDIISESETTDNARRILHDIFMVSPQFTLGDALLEVAKNTVQAQVLSRFGMDTYKSPLFSDLIAWHYIALFCVGVFLMCLNLAIEYDCFEAFIVRLNGDAQMAVDPHEPFAEDVKDERHRVTSDLKEDLPLRLRTIGNINAGFVSSELELKGSLKSSRRATYANDVAACVDLSRVYRGGGARRVAVDNLTFGLPARQCTALLGENGAGKSTTFSMLSGETRPSGGQVYLQHQMVNSRELNTGLVSYCPQNDAIDSLLSVRETLHFYCKLRGIIAEDEVISRTLSTFELTQYGRVACDALSGGNKRKLCAAIALMSRAPLILLDEPTSGMDAGARRLTAAAVRAAVTSSRAALLSTHALLDAAAAAHRVALMRKGRLRALASTQDCLQRFCGGYVVVCRVSRGASGRVWRALRNAASHAALIAAHNAALHVHLPARYTVNGKEMTSSVGDVFRLMANLQGSCDVEDYTVNQSSLEQMFLNFTDKRQLHEEMIDIDPLPSPPILRQESDEPVNVTAL